MIELRQEMPCDYRETEHVIREAFWNHYTPACNDHYLIHIMRNCPAFVPELDIVAVKDGRIIGNSMCLKSYISGDDGKYYEVLSLGPICREQCPAAEPVRPAQHQTRPQTQVCRPARCPRAACSG